MNGLNKQDIDYRINNGLVNNQKDKNTKTIKKIILDNTITLFNILNIVLLVLVLTTRSFRNGLFAIIIVVNTIIAIGSELKAKRIIDKLKLATKNILTVVREGKKQEINEDEVLLDDIIYFSAGDTDTADKNNQTDQTGKDDSKAEEEAAANAAKIEKYSEGLAKTEIINLKAEVSRKKVKLTWKKSMSGYAVDNYQIWRSAKKSSGYSKIFTSTSPKNLYYINTKDVKPNTTYWYKVRGIRVICGKTLYTPFTKIKVTTKA